MKNRKGFTLVEILAVIVILGILMVVAIGAYSRYKEKARIQAYDTMAKSASLAMEEFRLKHARISSIDFDTLYENDLISSITDPSSKTKCEGKVSVISVKGSEEEIASDSYIVNLCCSNYNYTYRYPEGSKTEDTRCMIDEAYDTDGPRIENLVVTSTTPNYNNKVVNISFDAVDDTDGASDLKMCFSTSVKCDDYVPYVHDSVYTIDNPYNGKKKAINVFLKDTAGNTNFESIQYVLYNECHDPSKMSSEWVLKENTCSAKCGEGTGTYNNVYTDIYTGVKCSDSETKTDICKLHDCCNEYKYVEGNVCSASCGDGTLNKLAYDRYDNTHRCPELDLTSGGGACNNGPCGVPNSMELRFYNNVNSKTLTFDVPNFKIGSEIEPSDSRVSCSFDESNKKMSCSMVNMTMRKPNSTATCLEMLQLLGRGTDVIFLPKGVPLINYYNQSTGASSDYLTYGVDKCFYYVSKGYTTSEYFYCGGPGMGPYNGYLRGKDNHCPYTKTWNSGCKSPTVIPCITYGKDRSQCRCYAQYEHDDTVYYADTVTINYLENA